MKFINLSVLFFITVTFYSCNQKSTFKQGQNDTDVFVKEKASEVSEGSELNQDNNPHHGHDKEEKELHGADAFNHSIAKKIKEIKDEN
jgi:hypothetical protein